MRNGPVAVDQFAGLEMPPEIGVGYQFAGKKKHAKGHEREGEKARTILFVDGKVSSNQLMNSSQYDGPKQQQAN